MLGQTHKPTTERHGCVRASGGRRQMERDRSTSLVWCNQWIGCLPSALPARSTVGSTIVIPRTLWLSSVTSGRYGSRASWPILRMRRQGFCSVPQARTANLPPSLRLRPVAASTPLNAMCVSLDLLCIVSLQWTSLPDVRSLVRGCFRCDMVAQKGACLPTSCATDLQGGPQLWIRDVTRTQSQAARRATCCADSVSSRGAPRLFSTHFKGPAICQNTRLPRLLQRRLWRKENPPSPALPGAYRVLGVGRAGLRHLT